MLLPGIVEDEDEDKDEDDDDDDDGKDTTCMKCTIIGLGNVLMRKTTDSKVSPPTATPFILLMASPTNIPGQMSGFSTAPTITGLVVFSFSKLMMIDKFWGANK